MLSFLIGVLLGLLAGIFAGLWIAEQGGVGAAADQVRNVAADNAPTVWNAATSFWSRLMKSRLKWLLFAMVLLLFILIVFAAFQKDPTQIINLGLNLMKNKCGELVTVDVTLQDVARGFVPVGTGDCRLDQPLAPNN